MGGGRVINREEGKAGRGGRQGFFLAYGKEMGKEQKKINKLVR